MPYKLVKQVGRVKEYVVPLTKNQEDRAMNLHEKSVIFDLHMHSWILPDNMNELAEWHRDRRAQETVGYEGIKKGGVTAFIEGLGGLRHSWTYNDVVESIGFRLCNMDHNYDKVIRGLRADDVRQAKKEGKFVIFIGVENAEQIGYDVDKIDVLYGLGVRSMGLSYNRRNPVTDGRTERTDSGLSNLGYEVIARMNDLGMIIDVAHSGEKTTFDVTEASKDPVIISHTGARKLYLTKRLATDEELQAVAEKGGLVGVHTGPNILSNKKRQGVEDVVNHIDYCVNLIGVDHVSVGSDNYFGDKVMNLKYEMTFDKGMKSYLDVNALYTEGIENPSEWPNITRELVKRGYSDQEIQKIIGGNALRIVEKIVG